MSGQDPLTPTVVDLSDALVETGDGVHWTLQHGSDLNVNLVRLDPGRSVDDHVNRDVDVAVIVLAGRGTIHIDGASSPLRPHVVAHIPRGSARRIDAGPDGLGYLTVHRRRMLDVATKPRSGDGR